MWDHLTYIDLGVFLVLSMAVFFLATEVGFRFGRRRARLLGLEASEDAIPVVSTIDAALLGLLALMLSFAFAMAMGRYDDRKQVILAEANDIRTAYLRSALLPPQYREKSRRLLLAYLDSRIAGARSDANQRERQVAHAASRRLQRDLWVLAMSAIRIDSNEVTSGYFSNALEAMISDYNRRLTAISNHVPEIIIVLLIAVAILALAVTGGTGGLKHVRILMLRLILSSLVAGILAVILDLDRPGQGLIQISSDNLIELRKELPSIDPHLAGLEAERR